MKLKSKDLDIPERKKLESELDRNKVQLTQAIRMLESTRADGPDDEEMLPVNEDQTHFNEQQILKIYSLNLHDQMSSQDELDASPIDHFYTSKFQLREERTLDPDMMVFLKFIKIQEPFNSLDHLLLSTSSGLFLL